MEHGDYVFVLAVIDRILASPKQVKLRQLRAAAAVVARVKPFLLDHGFTEREGWLLLPEIHVDRLRVVRPEIQRMVDETRNPETVTFADVAEILRREGTLPGIRTDIDDTPLELNSVLESERPLKPWEVIDQ